MTLQYTICSLIFLILACVLLIYILKENKPLELIIYFNLLCLIISLCFIMYGNYQNRIMYINIGLAIIVIKTIIIFFVFKYMELGDA